MYCSVYFKSRIRRLAATEDVYGENDKMGILDEARKVLGMLSIKVVHVEEDRDESKEEEEEEGEEEEEKEEGICKSQRLRWSEKETEAVWKLFQGHMSVF